MENLPFKFPKEDLDLFLKKTQKERRKGDNTEETFVKGKLMFGFLDFAQQCSWKVQPHDFASNWSSDSAVMRPPLEYYVQLWWPQHKDMDLLEGHEDDQGAGTPPLWKQAERAGVVSLEQRRLWADLRATSRPSSTSRGPTRKLVRVFCQGHVIGQGGMGLEWKKVSLD